MTPPLLRTATVIGGGFAGLSAAVRLVQAGVRVALVEARPRLGGRATSFTDPASGERVDNGQHLMLGCYRETFAFLDVIGAHNRVIVQLRLDVPFVDREGRRTTLACPMLPSPFHLLGGLLDWDALAPRDRFAAFKLGGVIRVAMGELRGARGDDGVIRHAASPGETVESWLVRNGQTPRLREMLWNPLAIAALNQAPSHAAAPYFSRVLAEMLAGGTEGTSIATPAVPLDELYAEPARAWLESRGCTVTTGSRARVVVRNGAVAGVKNSPGVSFPGSIENHSRTIPVVIVAVPWHALPSLFEGDIDVLEPILAAARGTPASPIVTVNLWMDGAPLDAPFVGLPGRTIQWVFDKRVIFGRHATHLSLVSSAAGPLDDETNDAVVRLAIDELCDALPELRASRIVRANVVRERRATFSLAPGAPPRPGVRTPVAGLYLAGDWIDTGLPGTIESAVRSGHMAADAALAN